MNSIKSLLEGVFFNPFVSLHLQNLIASFFLCNKVCCTILELSLIFYFVVLTFIHKRLSRMDFFAVIS